MTGQVIDKATQGPLEGAEVKLIDSTGTEITDLTDASGNFSIECAVGVGRLSSITINEINLNFAEITFNVTAGVVNIGVVEAEWIIRG